ncbi:hypothetical protein QYS48_31130 [Marivirga arenosa]|uniref:Uncharacterized protein n=1 Tax=Marivirga arenosa TaxID=3059076 RepID=A0AA51N4P0_9BACT|nr:hypothetical protein [Marivirga sp. ABR2-2]WMN05968.1 hypothetical protein QYS48_31130 [Marivirga sp. ABR2-2]
METLVSRTIDKNDLSKISFIKNDVLLDENDALIRLQKLNKALILGNLHKTSVKIEFMNAEGELLNTVGTVWAVTEKNVLLKKNYHIPIKSIVKVAI